MIILTTTYNCEDYIERSLLSIISQNFKDFTCYITDDMSTDNTVNVVKRTIQGDSRFILIENKSKMFQSGNYNQVIRLKEIPDEEICVEVDGDDWLPHSNVFTLINEVYKDTNVWMTSGSFKYHDGRPGFANPPTNFTNIRNQTFTLSHLRTWKSWLWKKIKEEDLKDENGNYWDIAGDLSFMYPMVEMSGEKHFKYITEVMYIYNESNPINDHKINLPKVYKTANIIRNKQPYEKLILYDL
jgi:glycosyltransferase involved in cell wall biosynthesis